MNKKEKRKLIIEICAGVLLLITCIMCILILFPDLPYNLYSRNLEHSFVVAKASGQKQVVVLECGSYRIPEGYHNLYDSPDFMQLHNPEAGIIVVFCTPNYNIVNLLSPIPEVSYDEFSGTYSGSKNYLFAFVFADGRTKQEVTHLLNQYEPR